jgi:hypothetical protein
MTNETPPVLNALSPTWETVERVLANAEGSGIFIISPIGTGAVDDLEQVALLLRSGQPRPHAFVVAGRGGDKYDLLDLNNLPRGTKVRIDITANGFVTGSEWEGKA